MSTQSWPSLAAASVAEEEGRAERLARYPEHGGAREFHAASAAFFAAVLLLASVGFQGFRTCAGVYAGISAIIDLDRCFERS